MIQNSRLSSKSLCSGLWKPSWDSATLWTYKTYEPDTWDYAEAMKYWEVAILPGFLRNPDWPISIGLSSTESQAHGTQTLLRSLHAAWDDARDHLFLHRHNNPKFENEYRKSRDFNSGDLVFLRRSAMKKNPKLELCWIVLFQFEAKKKLFCWIMTVAEKMELSLFYNFLLLWKNVRQRLLVDFSWEVQKFLVVNSVTSSQVLSWSGVFFH